MIDYKNLVEKFLEILRVERNLSAHSLLAYHNDLTDFIGYIRANNYGDMLDRKFLTSYLYDLGKKELAQNSYLRKLSSLRGFIKFLIAENLLNDNFLDLLQSPKKHRTLPKFLTIKEVFKLLRYVSEDKSDRKSTRLNSSHSSVSRMPSSA